MNWAGRFLNTAYVGLLSRVERAVPFWPQERIERLQERRLRAAVRYAYATVPFYRQAMDERGLRPQDVRTAADLAELPLIDARTVRADVEQFTSTACPGARRQAFYSSGTSSGVHGLVYWDDASVLREIACRERDRAVLSHLVGKSWGQRTLTIVPATSISLQLRACWDSWTLLSDRIADRHVADAMAPMEETVERIWQVRPHVIYSYGSYADHFVRFLVERGLRIPPPRVWAYSSDALSEGGRELLESVLGCKVYSTYSTTETLRLGFQCERCQGYHLNADLCAVRLVDEQGRTVAPGQSGEVVISNLRNRATVLLNYRLGDRGVLATAPCPCGRTLPLLDPLEGRSDEVILLGDGRAVPALILEMACKEPLKGALASQLEQPRPGAVLWRVVPLAGADRDGIRQGLREMSSAALGGRLAVTVEFAEDIPLTPRGKLRRMVPPAPERG